MGLLGIFERNTTKFKIGVADIVDLDATLTEDVSYDAEITKHPVEFGADITDNVRNKPLRLRFEGILSDTPTQLFGTALSIARGQFRSPISKEKLDLLLSMRASKTLVDVQTGNERFQNMLFSSIAPSRSPDVGKGLRVRIEMEQVVLIESTTIDLNSVSEDVQSTASPEQDLGTQTPTTPDESILSKIFGSI